MSDWIQLPDGTYINLAQVLRVSEAQDANTDYHKPHAWVTGVDGLRFAVTGTENLNHLYSEMDARVAVEAVTL